MKKNQVNLLPEEQQNKVSQHTGKEQGGASGGK